MRSGATRGLAVAGIAAALILGGGGSASAAVCTGPNVYPGDSAAKPAIAVWMARGARDRGIPGELPVMGALVESNLTNLNYGDSDDAGYFQIRIGIWNQGEYAGFPDNPDLQLKWFIDRAIEVRDRAIIAGYTDFGADPNTWGEWVADVERPAEQYRGRYQLQLNNARALIGELCTNPPPAGDGVDQACDDARAALAKAKRKLKQLQRRDAGPKAIAKAKKRVRRARAAVDAACATRRRPGPASGSG